jgi:hypothetical protein
MIFGTMDVVMALCFGVIVGLVFIVAIVEIWTKRGD